MHDIHRHTHNILDHGDHLKYCHMGCNKIPMHIYHKIYIGIYDLIIALILFYYDALCSVI